ncbi:class I SAM-dependent methyltransferase [Candidatus Woesearchaeota archaeon]|nr:class I SAM-dependent methyltransferase [Candidatus Woesearchaeota archaeon]
MKSKRLERLIKGKGRGTSIIKVFEKYFKTLNDKKILDVGCGYGSLTIDFAKYFKQVHSIDAGDKPIKITRERVKKNKLKNVIIKKDNALYIKSTKNKFDVIHLSGVFEWLRAGNLNKSAYECQNLFLKTIKKFMKKNTILYSGTENKMFPVFWLKDPHNNKWPIVVLLPEKISDFIFKILKRKKYIAKIYSYWTLKKIFKNFFSTVNFYIPIPHYQYVYEFADINNKKEVIKKCNKVLKEYKLDFKHKFSIEWIKFWARFGLIKLFTPGFITIAKK